MQVIRYNYTVQYTMYIYEYAPDPSFRIVLTLGGYQDRQKQSRYNATLCPAMSCFVLSYKQASPGGLDSEPRKP